MKLTLAILSSSLLITACATDLDDEVAADEADSALVAKELCTWKLTSGATDYEFKMKTNFVFKGENAAAKCRTAVLSGATSGGKKQYTICGTTTEITHWADWTYNKLLVAGTVATITCGKQTFTGGTLSDPNAFEAHASEWQPQSKETFKQPLVAGASLGTYHGSGLKLTFDDQIQSKHAIKVTSTCQYTASDEYTPIAGAPGIRTVTRTYRPKYDLSNCEFTITNGNWRDAIQFSKIMVRRLVEEPAATDERVNETK